MRCQEIMTKSPATVKMNTPVQEVARRMAERDIGFIPIVDDSGRAIGTVTDRDITIRVVAKGLDPKSTKLSDFGGNEVVCCSPEDDMDRARDLMQQHKVQRILVCDAQKKHVGVFSLQDIARAVCECENGKNVSLVITE